MVGQARTLTLVALPLAVTIGLSGCGTERAGDHHDDSPVEQPGVGPSPRASAQAREPRAKHADFPHDTDIAKKNLPVDPNGAVAEARAQGAIGSVYSIGADYDQLNRTWVYDVQTKTKSLGYRAQIDGVTGEPIEAGANSTFADQPVNPDGPLPYRTAVGLATAKVEGRLASWELRQRSTTPSYQFQIERSGRFTAVSVDVKSHRVTVHD